MAGLLLAGAFVLWGEALHAQPAPSSGKPQAAEDPKAALERYLRARRAFNDQAAAYWRGVSDKRRARFAKRRSGQPVGLDDYVLTQPPLYKGPPRPPVEIPADRDPERPRPPIPEVADFLAAAKSQFGFVPDAPENELAFKRAYARTALAAGLTRDQIVRIYAFETGGNGTYDVQAGLTHRKPGSRAISAAIGYNQLLSTNTIGLLAEHGDAFVRHLREQAKALNGDARQRMERKAETLVRMIAFTRTVPFAWAEHDRLSKTPGGIGVHAAVLDRDIGPLLQTQKLLNSVIFARARGVSRTLTAAELEMMNFTGDGNGIDLVTMPEALRPKIPTSNFFQQAGYERNPIARRTATVAGLYHAIEERMDRASQQPGARDLASVD